jgi:hypothetical protein
VIEQPPLGLGAAVQALARCGLRTAALLARRRLHQPGEHVGRRCRFADGTTAVVYRETVADRAPPESPAVLVVSFRLQRVRSPRAHALFRLESVLNTALFAGFPGFVSKLWFAHDENGVYRGLYDWDDPGLAEAYVRALWWVLALVSVPASIHYAVLPGLRRDQLLGDPHLADATAPGEIHGWWRLVEVEGAVR